MIRQHLQTEENFWPCVSDMFLALFVIALALYSVCNEEKGKGDAYIAEMAQDEAVTLITIMKKIYPGDEQLKAMDPEAAKKADKKSLDSPKLSALLYATAENASCKQHFNLAQVKEHRLLDKAAPVLRNACRALCQASGVCFHEEGEYHQCIKVARDRVTCILAEMDAANVEELIGVINSLRSQLDEAQKGNAANEDAQKRIARLLNDIQKQKDEKRLLEGELVNAQKNNAYLKAELNRDNRKQVMKKVKIMLERYPELYESSDVLEEEGVVRIPAEAIGFETNKAEPTQASRFYVTQLAQFLDDVAQDVVKDGSDALPVDNISIECHASPDGNGIYNDWLSVQRVFEMWKILNKTSPFLRTYKNKKSLGLFSSTGCGSRVCPKGVDEDDRSAAALQKWRRVEIRFNCSPQRVAATQDQ